MSSLALPYLLQVEGDLQRDNTFRLDFRNRGGAGALFHVRSGDYTDLPRSYTIGPGRHLSDAWSAPLDYDLSVFGPNAFFRQFQGDTIGRYRTDLAIRTHHDDDRLTIVIASASPHGFHRRRVFGALLRGDELRRLRLELLRLRLRLTEQIPGAQVSLQDVQTHCRDRQQLVEQQLLLCGERPERRQLQHAEQRIFGDQRQGDGLHGRRVPKT